MVHMRKCQNIICFQILLWITVLLTLIQCKHQRQSFHPNDGIFMKRAIQLAKLGYGKTHPNPCVGCIIVNDTDNMIVSDGWHKKAGLDHAEAAALRKVNRSLHNCTAYVTLEPCSHFGRTPPCSHALVKWNVSRVVVGTLDTDSRVAGKGIQYLISHGVKVQFLDQNISNECRQLNQPFFHRIKYHRPYLTLVEIDSQFDIVDTLDLLKSKFFQSFVEDMDSYYIPNTFLQHYYTSPLYFLFKDELFDLKSHVYSDNNMTLSTIFNETISSDEFFNSNSNGLILLSHGNNQLDIYTDKISRIIKLRPIPITTPKENQPETIKNNTFVSIFSGNYHKKFQIQVYERSNLL